IGFRSFFFHMYSWLVHFREVGQLGRPVVHFSIYVKRVFAIPGRLRILIPYPLQVSWLGTGTRTRNEQIATKLEIQLYQLRIGAAGKIGDPLVGGFLGFIRNSQVQIHPVKIGFIVSFMSLQYLTIRFFFSLIQIVSGSLYFICTYIIILLEIA